MGNKTEQARVDVILNGQQANASINEIRAGVRALKAELDKIKDPLNSSEFADGQKKLNEMKDRLGDVTQKANESGNVLKELSSNILSIGVVLGTIGAAGYAAFQGIEKVMNSTWGTSITLKGTIEGLKAGYDSLFVSINTGDWSNMFSNFQTASKLAKDLVDQQEKLNLMLLTNSIKNSQLRAQATSLYEDIYTATSKESKLEAIQKYLDLMHQVMDNDIKVAKQQELTANIAFDKATVHLKLTADEAVAITNMNADQREYYKIYNTNLDLLTKAENKLQSAKDKNNETAESQAEFEVNRLKKLTTAAEQTAGFHKDLAEKVKEFYQVGGKIDENTGIPAVIKDLIDSKKAISDAEISYNSATRRMLSQKKSTMAGLANEDNAYQKKYEEYQHKLLEIKQEIEKATVQLITDQRDKELSENERDFIEKIDQIKGDSVAENKLREDLLVLANKRAAAINAKYDDKNLQAALKTEKEKWDGYVKEDNEGLGSKAEWYADNLKLLEVSEKLELTDHTLTEQQKTAITAKYTELRHQLDDKDEKSDKPVTEKTPTELSGNQFMKDAGVDLNDVTRSYDQKRALLKIELQKELDMYKGNESQIQQVKKDSDAALTKLNLKHLKDLLDAAKVIMNSLSQINQTYNDYENQELQKDQDVNDQKKANLQKQLDAKQITQDQYNTAVSAMDQEYADKKKKLDHEQAVRAKEIAVFNATIAFIQAVIMASNINPPADVIFPAIIAALDGIQLAALIAEPVPAAAKGKYDVIGQDDGKSYSADWGGKAQTGIYTKPTLIAEAGPELVVDAPTLKNIQVNYPSLLAAINQARVPQYASGQYYQNSSGPGAQPKMMIAVDPRLSMAIEKLNNNVETGIVAVISYDYQQLELAKINQIKKDVAK
jgi:hypothetical protein